MIIKPSRNCNATDINSSTIEVPRQTSFHVPEGCYCASIHSVRILPRNLWFPLVRILFKVLIPGQNVDYLAKIDLKADLHEGSDLWTLICRLVGRAALQEASESTFNLDSLVGVPADIEIHHNRDKAEDYDFPLVIVTDVQRAGTCVNPI